MFGCCFFSVICCRFCSQKNLWWLRELPRRSALDITWAVFNAKCADGKLGWFTWRPASCFWVFVSEEIAYKFIRETVYHFRSKLNLKPWEFFGLFFCFLACRMHQGLKWHCKFQALVYLEPFEFWKKADCCSDSQIL